MTVHSQKLKFMRIKVVSIGKEGSVIYILQNIIDAHTIGMCA